MSLNFEQNSIHLIDINHGLKDLVHVLQIKLNAFIKQLAIEVEGSVGWNMLELALDVELLSVGDLTVVELIIFEEGGYFEDFISEEFH